MRDRNELLSGGHQLIGCNGDGVFEIRVSARTLARSVERIALSDYTEPDSRGVAQPG